MQRSAPARLGVFLAVALLLMGLSGQGAREPWRAPSTLGGGLVQAPAGLDVGAAPLLPGAQTLSPRATLGGGGPQGVASLRPVRSTLSHRPALSSAPDFHWHPPGPRGRRLAAGFVPDRATAPPAIT